MCNSDFPRSSNFVHSHHKLANLNTNSAPDKENHSEKGKFFNDLKENKTAKELSFFQINHRRWDVVGETRNNETVFKIKKNLLFNISKRPK